MKSIIKKADIILFFALVALGVILTVVALVGNADGTKVVIRVDGEIYGTYSLSRDRTIEIENDGNHNKVVIEDGKVHMEESSCSNQICVNQGWVEKGNLPIVCLPNRVTVVIVDEEEGGYDVVTR